MGGRDERLLRVALPVGLIRRLDEALLQRLGDLTTRSEFVREAVENLLLELSYESAPPEPGSLKTSSNSHSKTAATLRGGELSSSNDEEFLDSQPGLEPRPVQQQIADVAGESNVTLQATILSAPSRGVVIDPGIAEVEDEHLFGLHNRDYPSFWAAHQLAELTSESPIELERGFEEIVTRAWSYADRLRVLEDSLHRKLRAMFPTNLRKRQSAEGTFRNFAIGSVNARDKGGRVRASGPLFMWQICQLERANDDLFIGMTRLGYELLEKLDGISLDTPHAPEFAERFLDHLRSFAPTDWQGFSTLLSAVAEEPNREELIRSFESARPDWKSSVASTNSQGYLGRAREWGLVEPKQMQGRYLLTSFGEDVLKDMK